MELVSKTLFFRLKQLNTTSKQKNKSLYRVTEKTNKTLAKQ